MRLSVITVNLNNRSGLLRTLKSVFEQVYRDFELIVIDGGSDDGSRALLEEHDRQIDHWVSEKDSGIYEAMNKGITKARGEYLLFLNSGDWLYCKETLVDMMEKCTPDIDIIYGNMVKVDLQGDRQIEARYPSQLTFNYFFQFTLPHQASFIKASLFEEVGRYDQTFKIVADWAFFTLAVCKYNKRTLHVSKPVCYFDTQGIGSSGHSWALIQEERSRFLDQHFPAFVSDYRAYNSIKNLKILKLWKAFQQTSVYKFLRS